MLEMAQVGLELFWKHSIVPKNEYLPSEADKETHKEDEVRESSSVSTQI